MIIRNNPFTSKLYKNKWNIHFHGGKPSYGFKFIKGIEFTKNKFFPLYYNVGKYKSCGMSYNLQEFDFEIPKNKVFLIYDVPDYFQINTSTKCKNLGLKKVKQYEGYLIELHKFDSLDSYLKNKFNSKRRNSLLSGTKKLEKAYDISYEFYHGEILPEKFSELFDCLYNLIEDKFKNKKQENSHTKQIIWDWYTDLVEGMINEKSASLFVIKNEATPIAISLGYNSDKVFFAAIPGTNDNFSKYGIGSTKLLKSIGMAISENFSFFDLGKGSYGYKHRWATKKYDFEYHILYNKKSPISVSIATLLIKYYQIKQFVRKRIR